MQLSIRRAVLADADSISALLTETSNGYVLPELSEAGRKYYLGQLAPGQIGEKICRGTGFRFYVAEFGAALAGVSAIKSNNHLYYLFTAATLHRKGIARQLWDKVRGEAAELGNPGLFTVNASLYAVPAYQKLGFAATGGQREFCGIRYVPMEYKAGG